MSANKVLMIAFHYPPLRGSSGILRTLKFSRYLPAYGWQPIVLTAHPRAYPQTGDDQLREIPPEITVERAFALDSGRHLSVRGRYPRWLALPDRWISWWFGAVLAGLRLIRRHRPKVIWSTYPIATAHLVGLTLARISGLPWVADFRDSMTEENYPHDRTTWKTYRWIERKTVQSAGHCIFTAESTRRMYLQRYPQLRSEQGLVILNGYDEEDFREIMQKPGSSKLRLLHAGLVYPQERDPRPFFRAVSRLKREGAIHAGGLRVDLRAAGSEEYYFGLLQELGIQDFIHLLPALPYQEALQDCADADGLLLFQGSSCNHQIPAKVYEYFRLQKPILALTSEEGDTAAILRECGGATIADMEDENEIHQKTPSFLRKLRDRSHPLPDHQKVQQYSRQQQAGELATLLFSVGQGKSL